MQYGFNKEACFKRHCMLSKQYFSSFVEHINSNLARVEVVDAALKIFLRNFQREKRIYEYFAHGRPVHTSSAKAESHEKPFHKFNKFIIMCCKYVWSGSRRM